MQRLLSAWKLLYDAWPVWIWILALIGFLLGLFIAWLFWYKYVKALQLEQARNEELRRKVEALRKREKSDGPKEKKLIKGPPSKAFSIWPLPKEAALPVVAGLPFIKMLKAEDGEKDDLTQLDGIDADMASRLNEAGIYRFSQLENLDDDQRSQFSKHFGLEDIDWDWWKLRWGGGAQSDLDLGLSQNFAKAPEDADDLTELEGIDSEMAAELNSAGIYRFDQLESMGEDQRRNLGLKFGWPALAWGSWSTFWTRRRKEQKEREEELARAKKEEEKKAAAAAAKAEKEAEAEQERLRLQALIPEAWQDRDDVVGDDDWGFRFTKPPKEADDLTQLEGIDADAAAELNAEGIYTFAQLKDLDSKQQKRLGSKFKIGPIDWDSWRLSWGESDPDIDLGMRTIYETEPEDADDLTLLEGIDADAAKQLNEAGIYKFDQLENLSDTQRTRFGLKFGWPAIAWPAWGLAWKKRRDEREAAAEKLRKEAEEKARLQAEKEARAKQKADDEAKKKKEAAEKAVQESTEENEEPPPVLDLLGLGSADDDASADLVEKEKAANVPVNSLSNQDGKKGDTEVRGIFGSGDDDDEDDAEDETSSVVASTISGVKGGGKGRRVVFIMDVSRSLSDAQLRLSKSELAAGVQSLPEGALYQVIFFSGAVWFAHQRMVEGGNRGEDVVIKDGNRKMRWISEFSGHKYEDGNENLPGGEWREVTPANIKKTLKDIEAVQTSFGTTWHLPITTALHLDPDPKSIYFLTDGETARQDEVAQEMVALSKKNGSPKIHTIALMVPGASKALNHLAKHTGGKYSLVVAGGRVLKGDELIEYLDDKKIDLE